MSRISCNVTKDLLPSYLDEICSGESKELVEEHLLECPSCRRFMATLQEQDVGKDAPKVNFLKKANHYLNFQSLLGIVAPLLLLALSGVVIRTDMLEIYYVEMPVLMLLCAYVLGNGKERGLKPGREWLAPITGVAVTALALARQFLGASWVRILIADQQEILLPVPEERLGPYLVQWGLVIALTAIALLVGLIMLEKRTGRVFTVSRNLALLAINLVLSFDYTLYKMFDPEKLNQIWNQNLAVFGIEFILVTALLLAFRRIKGPKQVGSQEEPPRQG